MQLRLDYHRQGANGAIVIQITSRLSGKLAADIISILATDRQEGGFAGAKAFAAVQQLHQRLNPIEIAQPIEA